MPVSLGSWKCLEVFVKVYLVLSNHGGAFLDVFLHLKNKGGGEPSQLTIGHCRE